MLRVGSAAVGLLVCTAAIAQTDPSLVIRVPVRVVTAPTLVFDRAGRLVPGLAPTDFQLFDNGRPQRFELDPTVDPVSVVVAVQVNRDVRAYLPFISRVGSVVEALLVGETGEGAVIAYNGDVNVIKPFGSGDVQLAMRRIVPSGVRARLYDAVARGIALLEQRPAARNRVLVLIGQPYDDGSDALLADLRKEAERSYISIYSLTLPELGRSFVSDALTLEGPASSAERGGLKASVDLAKLFSVIDRSGTVSAHADPCSVLSAATGGTQIRFRRQSELEGGLSAIGVELRSSYLLSYSPDRADPGYHAISVQVDREGARTYARPGYWLSRNP
jgi:VWFA-related protein